MSNRAPKNSTIFRPGLLLILAAVLLLLIGLSGTAVGWDQYSQSKGTATYCAECHGDFRNGSYNSLSDGTAWVSGVQSGLHDVHRRVMLDGNNDCETCHGGAGSGRYPVLLDTSAGDPETGNVSCSGCHGREQDWTGNPSNPTEGWGAGLRQHHWNADALHPTLNLQVCVNCHSDADPANYTPVGENVLPTIYGLTHGGSDIPDDPCNPGPGFEEDYTGGANLGLDNDGDGTYDQTDPDCSIVCLTGGISFISKTTITWEAPASGACPIDYDVARGSLSTLRATGSFASAICLPGENGDTDLTATDETIPAAGDGFYYLTRVGTDSWGGDRDTTMTACQ